jgi:hypothetical protein
MRRLLLVPRITTGYKMQSPQIGMSRTRDGNAEVAAADKLAREQAHEAMMERLDLDLRDMLKVNLHFLDLIWVYELTTMLSKIKHQQSFWKADNEQDGWLNMLCKRILDLLLYRA